MAWGGDKVVAEGDAGCDLALIGLGRKLLFGAVSCLCRKVRKMKKVKEVMIGR